MNFLEIQKFLLFQNEIFIGLKKLKDLVMSKDPHIHRKTAKISSQFALGYGAGEMTKCLRNLSSPNSLFSRKKEFKNFTKVENINFYSHDQMLKKLKFDEILSFLKRSSYRDF